MTGSSSTTTFPAIREARRRIVEKYNFYQQVADLIYASQDIPNPTVGPQETPTLIGRHRLRLNPWNTLTEGMEILHYQLNRLFFFEKH